MSLDNATKEIQAALAKLRAGQALLDKQVSALEGVLAAMGAAPAKRRGRPPKAAAAPAPAPAAKAGKKKASGAPQMIVTKSGVKRKKAHWSPAAREAARKRMQEYWAKRRKG